MKVESYIIYRVTPTDEQILGLVAEIRGLLGYEIKIASYQNRYQNTDKYYLNCETFAHRFIFPEWQGDDKGSTDAQVIETRLKIIDKLLEKVKEVPEFDEFKSEAEEIKSRIQTHGCASASRIELIGEK